MSDSVTAAPVTTDANGNPTLKPTGKVAAGIATSGALVVIVAIIQAVNPELLAPLAPFDGVVYAGIVALGGFLGSYIKRPTGV